MSATSSQAPNHASDRRPSSTPNSRAKTQEEEDDEVLGKAFDQRIVARTWVYVHPYRAQLLWATLLMMCIAVGNLAGPYLIKLAIDSAIVDGDRSLLIVAAGGYVAASLLVWAATYGQTHIMSWVGQTVLFSMRRDLFLHLQRLSFNFYDRMEAGRIMSRMTGDVNALNDFLTSGIVAIASDVFVLLGIVVLMLALNWRLALATMIVAPIIALVTHLYRRRSRTLYREVRWQNSIVTTYLAENISGVRAVQAFAREDLNRRRFDDVNSENLRRIIVATVFSAGFGPIITFISTVATVTVIWFGGRLVIDDEMSLGSLWAFIAYVGRFFEPINELSARYNSMQAAMAGGERVYALLDTPVSVTDRPGARPLGNIHGSVRFNDVTFEYLPDRPVLRDLNIDAKPGEVIALVGHTGAGKSSIINILLRFYDIRSGAITIDGNDIRDVTTESLRRQVGLVLQEPFLFSGTIRDNIRYGKLDSSDDEVIAAAQAVNLHEYIASLPLGYDTEVNERGASLSQGQKQLISFARALIADPRILILDEATASVDTATEKLIQHGLETLMRGRTSFVIAHRLSTIKAASQIIVLRQGRVIERGTHDELLAREGYYFGLYRMQFRHGGIAEDTPEPEELAAADPTTRRVDTSGATASRS
ncbi:MAG: ABC transporter ATP-binding protein [Chloroflexota bacterium]|jgi:ABC-type multidrug transport system fused ATPase/permease subunit|nr:ABC transporter ATP-binding protein/permease [Chloroflexota bacterium]